MIDCDSSFFVEGTKKNEAYIQATIDVIPHQLVRIMLRDFFLSVQRHSDYLD